MGLSLPPEWELEQGHDPQEGVGILVPLPSFIWSGLGMGLCCPGGCCCPRSPPPQPLTTEEVVDDGVGSTVGVHQPVGEGEAGVDGFSVAGLAEHPEHPRTRGGGCREDVRNGQMCMCLCDVAHRIHATGLKGTGAPTAPSMYWWPFLGLWIWGLDHRFGFLSTEGMTRLGLGTGTRAHLLSHWLSDPLGLPIHVLIHPHSSMPSQRNCPQRSQVTGPTSLSQEVARH